MSARLQMILDHLKGSKGVGILALASLGALTGLCVGGKILGPEFVDSFESWCYIVFGGSAVAGFRDINKPATPPTKE